MSEPFLPTRLSMAGMRMTHAALLNASEHSDLPPGPDGRERVTTFVAAVAATGRFLNLSDDRRTAQGIIDFWVASLNTTPALLPALPAQGDGAPDRSPALPVPTLARLEPFDLAALAAAAQRAQAMSVTLPEAEQQLVPVMLAALLEPDEQRRQFRARELLLPTWLARCIVPGTLPVEEVRRLGERLVRQGLVLSTPSVDAAEPLVELAATGLVEEWAPLAEVVRQRRLLHERARLWDEGEKPSLLPGRKEPVAMSVALDPLEHRYATYNRDLSRTRLMAVVGVLTILLLLTTFVLTVLLYQSNKLRYQNSLLSGQGKELAVQAEAAMREKTEAQAIATEAIQTWQPIRRALADADAPALMKALRDADIDVSGVDVTIRPSPVPRALTAKPDVAPLSPTGVGAPVPARAGPICRGAIWVGTDGHYLHDAPAPTSGTWKGRSFTLAVNLNLRAGLPTTAGLPPPLGLLPPGTEVQAQGEPVLDPRPGPRQYFLLVEAPGPSCVTVYLQVTGPSELAKALADSLRAQGYTVPGKPEQLRAAQGLSEVRFYYDTEADSAAELARRVHAMRPDLPVTVQSYTSWLRAKPLRGTVELWVDVTTRQETRP